MERAREILSADEMREVEFNTGDTTDFAETLVFALREAGTNEAEIVDELLAMLSGVAYGEALQRQLVQHLQGQAVRIDTDRAI